MTSNAPLGAERVTISDSVRNWLAALLRYFELKLQLLGLESREAAIHIGLLGLLLAAALFLFGCFVVMLAVFLLYLVMQFTQWPWGYSALLCGGILLLLSIIALVILRLRIARPLFPLMFADIEKDREWLAAKNKKSESAGS
jgi:uncharacterized membrane protein YqjE